MKIKTKKVKQNKYGGKIKYKHYSNKKTRKNNTNKKTIVNSSEKSYINNQFTPLIPEVKDKVTNPNHLVEDYAVDGWVRGGLPSRDLTRDNNFYNKN